MKIATCLYDPTYNRLIAPAIAVQVDPVDPESYEYYDDYIVPGFWYRHVRPFDTLAQAQEYRDYFIRHAANTKGMCIQSVQIIETAIKPKWYLPTSPRILVDIYFVYEDPSRIPFDTYPTVPHVDAATIQRTYNDPYVTAMQHKGHSVTVPAHNVNQRWALARA